MIARLTAFIAVVIFAVSCSKGVSPVKTRSLSRPNPTVYSFPLPLEQVRTRAWQAFSIEHQAADPIFGRSPNLHFQSTLFAECSTNAVFSEAVFRDPGNTNDIYLHTFHTPFAASSVYCGRAGGLPFIAAFHLHLAAAGSNTFVTVTALDAEVVNGEKFGFGSCGPGYGWIYEKVKPTTVEEYSILRYLGHYLGITGMPEVTVSAQ